MCPDRSRTYHRVVERTRPVTVLTVFTGNPSHKVTVTALSPLSTLSPAEAKAEWDKAVHQLRRDGARSKEVSNPFAFPKCVLAVERTQDRQGIGICDIPCKLSFGLHHCSNPKRQLS